MVWIRSWRFCCHVCGPYLFAHLDNESDDEKANGNHSEKPWVVDMCELMRLDDTSPNVEKKKDHNQPSSSSTSMEKTLARMGDIM